MLLDEAQWRLREQQHRARVEHWTHPRLERRQHGQEHPVDDFLFEYYPYSPAKLATWHPGLGIVLQGDTAQFLHRGDYVNVADGVTVDVDAIASKRDRLDLALQVLAGTHARPAAMNCFGLHEWAMVYRVNPQEIRHSSLPLRLSPESIACTVESVGLRCTHIDAYRFFASDAIPLNAVMPTRATQPELEQPGCLHANMDIYKYAMWFQSYVGSELVADCFELARDARDLDMRASPYDVSTLGLTAIPVEHAHGRADYIRRQRSLTDRAYPLRHRLIQSLERLRDELRH